jgi:small basic protein
VNTSIWLAVLSTMMGVIGTLIALLYKDLIRRMSRVEIQSSAILMAVMIFMGKQEGIPKELVDKIYNAATSG